VIEAMADAVTSHLQEEVAKARRTFKIALIAMAIVLIAMIGYFQWMRSELQKVLEPTAITEFMVNEVRRSMPGASAAMKQSLRERAPEVVRYAIQRAVDGMLPAVRASFESSIAEGSKELVATSSDHAMVAFQNALKSYQESPAGKRGGDAATTGDQLAAHLTDELHKELDAAPDDSVQHKLSQSAEALTQIDARLKALATQHSPSEEDALGKRLITTWWTFLQRNSEDLAGGDLIDELDQGKPKGAAPKPALAAPAPAAPAAP
jgi:hypothetical protein